MDPQLTALLIELCAGILGGVAYMILPPESHDVLTDAKQWLRHLFAGGLVGLLAYLSGVKPDLVSLAGIIGSGYWGIDVIKYAFNHFRPKEGLSQKELEQLDPTTQLAIKNLEEATRKDFSKHPVKLGDKEFEKNEGDRLTSLNAGLFGSVWPARGVTRAEQYEHMVQGTPLGKKLVRIFSKKPPVAPLFTDLPTLQIKGRVLPEEIQILTIPDGDWGDTACRFGQYWNKKMIGEYARQLGFSVVELDGDQAKRTQFEAATAATSLVRGIEGTGHGDSTRYTGYRQDVLLEPVNYGNMRNRIGSFLSCQFGDSFQQRLSQGELAEHSYIEDFVFSIDNEDPTMDSHSKYFFCPHSDYFRALLEGLLHGPATVACITSWNTWLSKAPYTIQYYMQWDIDAQQFPGDDAAGLGGSPAEKVDKVEFYLDDALADTKTQPKTGNLYESIQTLEPGTYTWWSVPYYKGVRGQESAHITFEVEESSTDTSKAIAVSPKQGDKVPAGPVPLQAEAVIVKQT
jgi:hypothetical protein